MSQQIPLTRGLFTLVDDEDLETVSKHKWRAITSPTNKLFYAINGKVGLLHNFLLGTKPVDHKDGDGLNNCRSNLRPTTSAQNAANRAPNVGRQWKGVVRTTVHAKPYRCGIRVAHKFIHIGYFANPEDAATAYNFAAAEYFGEFARFNQPKQEALQEVA